MAIISPNGAAVKTAAQVAPVAKRSWNVLCPSCGEVGGIRLDPNDLGDDGTFNCTECDGEFTIGHMRNLLEAWPRVLAWLDLAPVAE